MMATNLTTTVAFSVLFHGVEMDLRKLERNSVTTKTMMMEMNAPITVQLQNVEMEFDKLELKIVTMEMMTMKMNVSTHAKSPNVEMDILK